jgi:hypothetical protein
MNPNAAPYPAAPNLAPDPITVEEVPQVNQPWENEVQDRHELDGVLRTARRIEQDEAAANDRVDQLQECYAGIQEARRTGNTGQEAFYQRIADQLSGAIYQGMRDRSVRRDDNDAALDQLMARSNPSALLHTLEREADAAREQSVQHDRAAAGAGSKAARADSTRMRSETMYYAATRYNTLNPTTDDDEKKQRERIMREINSNTSGDAIDARSASRRQEFAERTRDYAAGYPGAVDGLADRLRRRYAAEWSRADRLNRDINDDLRTWDVLAGPSHPNQPDDVRDQLVQLQESIDRLPPHDTARAEAQANYTRLRYRVEERLMHQANLNGDDPADRAGEYTANRGILLYGGTANEVIIHDDGSTERPDPTTGDWVRRNANGELWTPTTTELVIDPDAPVQPVGRAFSAWEENRTPETAAAAYASLTEHVREQSAVEAQHSHNIHRIDTETRSNNELITQATDTIAENNRTIPTLRSEIAANTTERDTLNANTSRNRAENKRLAELNDLIPKQEEEVRSRTDQNTNLSQTITDARADNARLAGERVAEIDARRSVREGLNPARYWHGMLEVNAERTVAEARARGIGRWIARRNAQRETDALPEAPTVLADGSLIFDTATINGRLVPTPEEREEALRTGQPIPNWQIWPDGTTSRYDLRTGNFVYYAPNGRRL